jgi:hypothetical protein
VIYRAKKIHFGWNDPKKQKRKVNYCAVYWILARKSNQNQIQILSDLDFKRFFMPGFGFGFDLKYLLKSKSNPNPCMTICRRCR